MRATTGLLITLSAAMAPALALADGGHLHERDGHSHWIGIAALGAVIVLAVSAAWSTEIRSAPKHEDETADTSEG